MSERADSSSGAPGSPLKADVVWLQFAGLTNELKAQRAQRDGLRTRAIAMFSAGVVVFGLFQARGSGSHVDGWLLASLLVLVTMGLCVAHILVPTAASGTPVLNPDDFDTDAEYWRGTIDRFRTNVRDNKRWENRAWILHSLVVCLLFIEASLIAAHFSTPWVGAAIVVLTLIGLFAFVFGPLRKELKIVQANTFQAFPKRFWEALQGVRLIPRLPFGEPSLHETRLPSSTVPPPMPGFVVGLGANKARGLEEALARGEDASEAIRNAHVLTLGEVAGDISANGKEGSETDLLHVSEEENGRERIWAPVFTDMPYLANPLREHHDWQNLSILELDGGDLMDAIDGDVEIRINPGSDNEGRIPPSGEPG